jgi:ATP-dependent RNA helicase RhlB
MDTIRKAARAIACIFLKRGYNPLNSDEKSIVGESPAANEDIMTETPDAPTPSERADKPTFLTKTTFDSFDLPESLLAGLKDAQFDRCTPIQAQVLPAALEGKDIAGQAQTGTGKTGAFLVTIFTRLLKLTDRQPGIPSALIVAPTRELAFQIHEEALLLGAHTGLSCVQIVGGVDYQKQAGILKKGVDIVICTPGRIIDYFKQGIFKTTGIKIVVIDEADRLLDLGFAKDMQFILRKLPHYDKRQSMLFSATLSHRVLELTYEYMNLPEFISVTPEEVTVERIDQSLIHVGLESKLSLLLGLLQREDWHRVLVFANTKSGVEWLTEKLKGNGFPAEGITGDLPQPKRFKLMEQFKNDQLKILVATDVASRGIHVEDISHVFNYDLPQDSESYVHRIGRTARAGKTGKAISLACENYVFHLEPLEEMLGYKLPVVWPEDDWLVKDKAGPVKSSRRTRPKQPPTRKPARPRNNQATERGPRAAQAAGRGPRQTAASRLLEKIKNRPPNYFPGSFFGFAPSKDMQAVADDQETPAADMTTETAAPAKKSRRRWRRKKKSSAHKAGAADSNAGATPSGDKPASDTAATAPRNITATRAAE